MFVLFTLFKLTLKERKTLTKISMHKTSHNNSPKPVHILETKGQENPQTAEKPAKGIRHNPLDENR